MGAALTFLSVVVGSSQRRRNPSGLQLFSGMCGRLSKKDEVMIEPPPEKRETWIIKDTILWNGNELILEKYLSFIRICYEN